jgi:hypothetical protein
MIGVGSVFSREYYELAASRLKEGGIMAQWFHVYDMHDGIVGLVLRTFNTVFPRVEVWDCGGGDIILLGSKIPWATTVEAYEKAFAREWVRKDLADIGILSPAALWARQLASQRTAFAIAQEGPIQTDWFPVLEYEAPKAFFLGQTSTLLSQFDERTGQAPLASPEKVGALESLDDATLRPIFGQYSSVNEDLRRQLQLRFQSGSISTDTASSLFTPPAARPIPVEAPPHVSKEIKQLFAACRLIAGNEAQKSEGIEAIEALLRSYRPNSDWPAARYAALAARASLSSGNAAKAKEILALAAPWAKGDAQVGYLARIADRETAARAPAISSPQVLPE